MKNRPLKISALFILILLIGCAGRAMRKDGESSDKKANIPESAPAGYPQPADRIEGEALVTIKPGEDLPKRFREIARMTNVRKIQFEPGDYPVADTLFLPRTGTLVVIEGQGSTLKARGEFPVFYSIPTDQKQAMNWNKTRFLIQNFGSITGGSKGIFIGSSFNTVIRNIEFIGQSDAAIDLVFCLMSTVENILVTNVGNDGIVLRSAVDAASGKQVWPGTSFNNSQCNHSVLRSCRVYNKKGCSGTSFKILQSTGVRLVDCISEGWDNRHAVFFDAKDCTTAKYFVIENFHLEHVPRDGALCFRSNGSTVEVKGLFLQQGSKTSPAIWLMNNGNYIFKNIPWWPGGAWVKSSNSPFVVIEQCKPEFSDFKNNWVNEEKPGHPIYPNYIKKDKVLVR